MREICLIFRSLPEDSVAGFPFILISSAVLQLTVDFLNFIQFLKVQSVLGVRGDAVR